MPVSIAPFDILHTSGDMTFTTVLDHLQNITTDDTRLGRFVLDRQQPHQDYVDPSLADPPFVESKAVSFDAFRKSFKSTSLTGRLTKFVKAALGHNVDHGMSISASTIKIQTLRNPGDWFERALEEPNTHRWITKHLDQGRTIHLVVAYCILLDAK